VYGLSDIDLVAVAADESESRRVRQRFEALCRALPPLRGLMRHFYTYDARSLATVLAGAYPVNGLSDGRAVFLGAGAVGDEGGVLERPGLHGATDWRRLRGGLRVVQPPEPHSPLHASWLELQHRWRYAFRACGQGPSVHRPALGAGLVSEAARIWLWLAHGERHDGRRAPLERALRLMPGEEEGLLHALEVNQALHRSPPVEVGKLLACFVTMSEAIARLVDEAAVGAGVTQVRLLGAGVGRPPVRDVALLDWRALALPVLDWSIEELPRVVEERLVPVDDDPGDPVALMAAAAGGETGRLAVLRRGSLVILPTFDVWWSGRLRVLQCGASDPVSTALLDGRAHAAFTEIRGWSASDWARRAVAEHHAWLLAGPNQTPSPHAWIGARPPSFSTSPATLGLLLSAARSALLLESIEEGSPELPLTFTDLSATLAARDPEIGADAAEACEVLGNRHDELRAPAPELVGRLRRHVESLPAYASRQGPVAVRV
jgi:hypothetical protein